VPTKDLLVVRNLYKIFGPHPAEAMKLVHQGIDKAQIFARTGHTLGVNDANFEVREGETFVVMGLSGSGKSTLVRMLNRLIDPTEGQVLFVGVDIARMNEKALREFRRKHISMVFQSFALMPHLTVLQNAAFGLELAGEPKAVRQEKAMKALHQVGLTEWANRQPAELSGGMQQRVGLARALANNPTILLMDEAFSALDPLIRSGMQDELIQLQQRDRRTIVFISHDINEALRIGDRIAIMEGGVVVQVGTADQIIKRPATEYVAAFFKDVDVAHVFRASELADMPAETTLVLGEVDAAGALERLKACGREHGFVVDRDRRYRGVVSQESLRRELRLDAQAGLQHACIDAAEPLPSSTPVYQMYRQLAACDHGLPVVDAEGRFQGAVTRRRVVEFLGQRAAASPTEDPLL
jgi:glycine betaine/proline transport system ATP-binding protein